MKISKQILLLLFSIIFVAAADCKPKLYFAIGQLGKVDVYEVGEWNKPIETLTLEVVVDGEQKKSQVNSVLFSPGGNYLACVFGSNKKIRIYNCQDWTVAREKQYDKKITSISFSPKDKFFAISFEGRVPLVLDTKDDGKSFFSETIGEARWKKLGFTKSGYLVGLSKSEGDNDSIGSWKIEGKKLTGETTLTLGTEATEIALSPKSDKIIVLAKETEEISKSAEEYPKKKKKSKDSKPETYLKKFDVKKLFKEKERVIQETTTPIEFSSGGKYLAFGTTQLDNYFIILSNKFEYLKYLTTEKSPKRFAFSFDDGYLAALDNSGNVRIYKKAINENNWEDLKTLDDLLAPSSIAFSPKIKVGSIKQKEKKKSDIKIQKRKGGLLSSDPEDFFEGL